MVRVSMTDSCSRVIVGDGWDGRLWTFGTWTKRRLVCSSLHRKGLRPSSTGSGFHVASHSHLKHLEVEYSCIESSKSSSNSLPIDSCKVIYIYIYLSVYKYILHIESCDSIGGGLKTRRQGDDFVVSLYITILSCEFKIAVGFLGAWTLNQLPLLWSNLRPKPSRKHSPMWRGQQILWNFNAGCYTMKLWTCFNFWFLQSSL